MQLKKFLERVSISIDSLITLVETSNNTCLFIKNEKSQYVFANNNFIHLMGLKNLSQLQQFSDEELSSNKHYSKVYRNHDSFIIEEKKELSVYSPVSPSFNQPLVKYMQGNLYPLFSKDHEQRYIMGITRPHNKLLKLDWDNVFKLSLESLNELLNKRSYLVITDTREVSVSKKEIIILILLLKGCNAREIAPSLQIKQTTVESYIVNIKNKFGVSLRSELIQYLIKNKLLEQIII